MSTGKREESCANCEHCYPYKKYNPIYEERWEHGYCCVMWTRYPREKHETSEDRKHRYVLILNVAPENEMCECWEKRKTE